MRRVFVSLMILSLLTSVSVHADELEVGAEAPEFSLKDQSGETHSLKELREQGVVAMVFYRSANW